jgi:hypothetical protein
MPLCNCLQGNHLLKMGVRKSVGCLCDFTTGLSKAVSFYVFTVSLPDQSHGSINSMDKQRGSWTKPRILDFQTREKINFRVRL